MLNGDEAPDGPTRRAFAKYGGTVALGGLLAGCTGGGDSGGVTASGDGTETGDGDGDTEANSTTSNGSNTEGEASAGLPYTAAMEPVGEVTFEAVPERWVAYDGGFADMAVALGKGDGVVGIGNADRYYTYVYDELSGVDVDRSPIEAHPDVRTKEQFYELDADVHLYDPQMLVNWFDWGEDDVTEIRDNVAPFFGNLIFRRSDEWHDYRYYTLYEAFERVAAAFNERERYEAFAELHESFIADVQSRLPATDDRPSVFLTFEGTDEPETFSPYRLIDKGTSKKQWLDLGVTDALTGTDIENLSTTNRGELDYENLIEVDPDVILVRGHERKSSTEFRDTVLAYMEDHPVGSELTAVKDGRVYRGGYLYQGPIHNLFLTERAAKQLYPDEFGPVTGDEELFDRQRIADVINGEF
ncbi:ABC transporter substrate-binding protein [Halorubrum cibi]|uniref:Ferrichrome-binding protein n=1 Tax=Halorubrum cibi TaxID=413815 RepID=A0A521EEV6_9EURY|nr:ABC transporter substrate-binding protein [Halorubrum cibi]SMO82415.1 ferrichrome-binding protein [Halorubrum cibi]